MRPPLAEALDLQPHPEGGWFRETFRSDAVFMPPGYDGVRAAGTAIYYLLTARDESAWHVVRSDELWLWHAGGALELVVAGNGDEPGDEITSLLGGDVAAGQQPQIVVPADTWQSARPVSGDVLVSCVVVPGFDFADFRLQR